MADLHQLLDEHRARPFPASVEEGSTVRSVDVVMVDSDIFGYATQRSRHALTAEGAAHLRQLASDLASALDDFPATAQPYYRALLERATVALAE